VITVNNHQCYLCCCCCSWRLMCSVNALYNLRCILTLWHTTRLHVAAAAAGPQQSHPLHNLTLLLSPTAGLALSRSTHCSTRSPSGPWAGPKTATPPPRALTIAPQAPAALLAVTWLMCTTRCACMLASTSAE
jgi:hypothetical protein